MAKIEILIPTYNRRECLLENLDQIDRLVTAEGLADEVGIIVSDNCSPDGTYEATAQLASRLGVEVELHRHAENVGLEPNVVSLLERATAPFVMFLGDDDYLPAGYLRFLVESIAGEPHLSAVIPGFSSLREDGSVRAARRAGFELRWYPPSFSTVLTLSYLGHQLSGLLYRRAGLLERYLADAALRNVYPFVFFLAFSTTRGTTCYAPRYQVLVSQDNPKDWKYDDSGLLTDFFRNYRLLYPDSRARADLLCIAAVIRQPWRLRVGRDPRPAARALSHLWRSKEVDLAVKASLLGLYPYLYLKRAGRALAARARGRES